MTATPALVEAHIHHDQEAWDAIISNADHEAVVSIIVMLLNESLTHGHHLTPLQFLANMRDAFTNPTPCAKHTRCRFMSAARSLTAEIEILRG